MDTNWTDGIFFYDDRFKVMMPMYSCPGQHVQDLHHSQISEDVIQHPVTKKKIIFPEIITVDEFIKNELKKIYDNNIIITGKNEIIRTNQAYKSKKEAEIDRQIPDLDIECAISEISDINENNARLTHEILIIRHDNTILQNNLIIPLKFEIPSHFYIITKLNVHKSNSLCYKSVNF